MIRRIPLMLVSVILAIGALAMGAALVYLFKATKARRPALPQIGLISAVAGAMADWSRSVIWRFPVAIRGVPAFRTAPLQTSAVEMYL